MESITFDYRGLRQQIGCGTEIPLPRSLPKFNRPVALFSQQASSGRPVGESPASDAGKIEEAL